MIEIQAKILVETFRHPDQIQVLMLVLRRQMQTRRQMLVWQMLVLRRQMLVLRRQMQRQMQTDINAMMMLERRLHLLTDEERNQGEELMMAAIMARNEPHSEGLRIHQSVAHLRHSNPSHHIC